MMSRFVRATFFSIIFSFVSLSAFAQVGVLITIAPPPLPVYEQPLCPGDGYIWTPGYWAYGDDFDDYYWVPGTWVLAPEIGFFWTPAYWGWGGDRFVFYDGYWGPQVGFYGGVNYGFGYFGEGYEGGRWDRGHFFYNRAVNNVNVTEIHNVYNTTIVNRTENRISYNGGNGGITVRPTPQQEMAARERHVPPVAAQTQHAREARTNPQQRASVNRGKPEIAATPRPGNFKEGVVTARAAGGPYNPPPNHGANRRNDNQPRTGSGAAANTGNRSGPPTHVRDLPPLERPSNPNSGDARMDKKYQQQQEKTYAKQQQEREKLSRRQEQQDQQLAKRNADAARQQHLEQQHQQQTQQLQQRHQQQQEQMHQRMQPPAPREQPRSKPPK